MARKAFSLGQNLGNPRIYGGEGDRGTGAGKGDRSTEVLGNPERAAALSRARGQRAVQEKDVSELVGGRAGRVGRSQGPGSRWEGESGDTKCTFFSFEMFQ